FIGEPDPSEGIGLEADTDVDADADADADTDSDADSDCPEPDFDLGSELGANIGSGNTCFGEDDFAKTCGGIPGPDLAYSWTAPYEGAFQIDLLGSEFDTVLTIRSACPEPVEIECNDDFQLNTSSGVQRNFAADQPVVLVVEGFNINCGLFQINIQELPPDAFAPTDTSEP
ncbi:MAG: hypothetical protein KC656_14150, partial [Myxococcales bacterium]|nr:hypothetical protein [Myxococcales bacterium]